MNYQNTFICVADDCPVKAGVIPISKPDEMRTIHAIQYALIVENPYQLSQEDIQFMVHAERNSLVLNDNNARHAFLQKPKPCLRTSALGKKYGWGVHFNEDGKAALYGVDSLEYHQFVESQNVDDIQLLKAMRNKRKL